MRCLAPFKKDTPQKITSTEFALGVLQIFSSNSNGRLKTNDCVSLLSPKTKTKCFCYQRPRPIKIPPVVCTASATVTTRPPSAAGRASIRFGMKPAMSISTGI